MPLRLTALALAWLAYFVLHSALASLRMKRWVAVKLPAAMPYYRLAFNAVAALLLLPIALLVATDSGPWLWRWDGAAAPWSLALRVGAALGFIASLRSYDLGAFLGWRPSADGTAGDGEALRISAWHRVVRHPWYFLLLVLIWSGDMNASLLLSALMISAYLVIGSVLEEHKLVAIYGAPYEEYRRSVGGLLPLPWRVLSRRRAAELEVRAAAKLRAVGPDPS